MYEITQKILCCVVISSTLIATATETPANSMAQITQVNQLRDVRASDWAYEALRSLVERYGCIVGYPNQTYQGNRALSRWEFAAGLNACLNAIERLLQDGVAVSREDIDRLKRLAREFASELAVLGARVDNLENRVAFLEDHQFSTTTKLQAEVIFALTNAWTDDYAVDSRYPSRSPEQQQALDDRPVGNQTTFSDRVRLNLRTSFTGKDLLKLRLQASTIPNLGTATGSDMARLAFDAGSLYDNNNVGLDEAYYRFPLFTKATVWIGARGLDLEDAFEVDTYYDLSRSGTGGISRFTRINPLINRGPEGSGFAFKYQFNKSLALTALYMAEQDRVNNPTSGNGLFNGNFSTGAQLRIDPNDSLMFAVTYLHSYFTKGSVNLSGSVGSPVTRDPFDGQSAANRDTVGISTRWKIGEQFWLGGSFAYGTANATEINSQAELWTWNAYLSIRDLLKEGTSLTFTGGQLPRVASVDGFRADRDTSHILEIFYKYPVTNNITLTPGFYVIFDPNHFKDNDDIWVGVLRTTFSF
jgi:hypothetical protein